MSSLPQPAWIALADGGPLAGLGQVDGAQAFQSTADPVVFTSLLRSGRPRIVILGTPPAGRRDLDVALAVTEDTELDLVAHEVRRGGSIVHLRPKEFQLLAMLAAHPGRAYTRRQLLDRVWGPGHAGDPRTVDVHIRWLRSKIESQPDVPNHLVTVRGVGYRLDPIGR